MEPSQKTICFNVFHLTDILSSDMTPLHGRPEHGVLFDEDFMAAWPC